MKWYWTPFSSPGLGGRVVADTERSRSGSRSSRRPIRVPLPTPDGPVTTNSLPGLNAARRAGGAYLRKWPTSSARCRCDRPPIVLLGEMRHCARILLTLTWPYFGTESSMSETFALRMYSGGESSRTLMLERPARRSFFSCARLVRTRFASLRASIRCVRDRSGAPEADLVAAGMGGDYTHGKAACKTT